MYNNFSKTGKIIIIINIILTVAVLIFHSYNVVRIKQTENKINEYLSLHKVSRDHAIYTLKKNGENLFLGDEFHTFSGLIFSIVTLLLSYFYIKNSEGYIAVSLAASSIFTSLVGGLLILYMFFAGKYDKRLN